jgi:hypothetical protein
VPAASPAAYIREIARPKAETGMRAEIEAAAADIERSLALLRRHL